MEFPLSDFFMIKLSFFDSDFNEANSSSAKFKVGLSLLYELNDESALSLILAFKICFFWSVTSDFVFHDKEVQMEVKNQNILIYQVE